MRSLFSVLTRPLARPAPAKAGTLFARSPAERQPTAGLISVEVQAAARTPTDGRLVIRGPDGAELFRKPLSLAPEPVGFWVAVHGQLLPDGEAPLTLTLEDASGAELARTVLRLKTHNRGALAERVADSLRRSGAPAVVDGVCDSGDYDYGDESLRPWFDRSEAEAEAHIQGLLDSGAATPEEAEALRHFVREGYAVLPGLIAPDHLARLNAALDEAVAEKHEGYEWGSSQRMHGLHEKHAAVRELWAHPKVLRMLGLIYDSPALPCQSLTYVFGSQQDHHQDTIHLTPFPAGYMCGVWTALEEVQAGSGELVVYPRTHRLPRVYTRTVGAAKVADGDFKDLGDRVMPLWAGWLKDLGSEPVVYRPDPGTVLIWHENLMHAGSRRTDLSKSRRSIVCHYFADGAVAYYDSLGTPGVTHLTA